MRFLLSLSLMWGTLAQAEELGWYKKRLIGMEVGPTGAQFGADPRDLDYCKAFNGADVVAEQLKVGSEYLVIWARDGEWAYYDSKIVPKCPGMGSRDILRETMAAAKPAKLPVVAYCVVQASGYAMREHPEWRMKDAKGEPIGRMCLNSEYLGMVEAIMAEIMDYGVDGFHIDMLDQGFGPPYGCWCDTCKKRFESEYHQPMPNGETWDAAWDRMLEFRYNTSARFEQQVREFVRQKKPNVSLDFNYHGYPPFTFEVGQRPVQHAVIGDFVTCESGVWGFSALGAGLTAQFVRAANPQNVYQVVMQRGVRFYHDQTARPLNDLRWEMFALLANGAQVTIVDKTPSSGVMDPVSYGRIQQVFEEVRAKHEQFGQPMEPEAGIYYSSRARDWYGREKKENYQDAFFGAHKAMVYAHIPAGVLLDENLNLERLRAFPVVILANTAIVSEKELALFRRYVEEGGKLLITGAAGMYDALGAPQAENALAGLIGAKAKEVINGKDNYVRFEKLPEGYETLTNEIPLDWPHLIYGPAVSYEPAGAEALGQLWRAERRWAQKDGREGTEFPSSPGEPAGPAALVNRIGKGVVLTLAAAPDAASASEYRSTEARTLLSNAVRWLNPNPPVRIGAPKSVETVVTNDPATRTRRIHFIACMAPPSTTTIKRPFVIPELIEDKPLYRATVNFRDSVKDIKTANPTTQVVMGKDFEFIIDDIHEVLTVRY